MVEAAIVTPLVILLIMSVIWGALFFRSYLTVAHSAKTGARAGSIAANDDLADYRVLQGVKKSLGAIPAANVIRIVVYNAATTDASPTSGCTAGTPVAAVCNVYSSSDLALSETAFSAAGYNADTYWPASSRSASRSGTDSFIGVYILAKSGANGLGIPGTQTVAKREVVRIEARSY